MKSLKYYLEESAKEYKFRIKTVETIDDAFLESMNYVLNKYEIFEVGPVKKTPMMKHPMDFYDITNSEVFMIDVIIKRPVSEYILQQELRKELNISEKYIVVRSDNSPLEVENNRITSYDEMDKEAKENGWTSSSKLSIDQEYPEHERGIDGNEFYGNNYNKKLINYMSKIASERPSEKYEAPQPLFSWLNIPTETPDVNPSNDFNNSFENIPKPVEKWNIDNSEELSFSTLNQHTSNNGNIDNDYSEYKKQFKDPKSGQKHVLKREKNTSLQGDNNG